MSSASAAVTAAEQDGKSTGNGADAGSAAVAPAEGGEVGGAVPAGEDASGATASPNKKILLGSPNKNASKQGVLKRKWADGSHVPAGRVVVSEPKELLSPYSTGLISKIISSTDKNRGKAGSESGDKKLIETSIYSRLIRKCRLSSSVKFNSTLPQSWSVGVEFHQVGVSGPAAYIPFSINIPKFEDASQYLKTYLPLVRPLLIISPQDTVEDETVLSQLVSAMSESNMMAVIELRNIESSACGLGNNSVLFKYVEKEVLAIFAPNSAASHEMPACVIDQEYYLIGMFVKAVED